MTKGNWTEDEAKEAFARRDSYEKGEFSQLLDHQITAIRPAKEVARLIAGLDEESEAVLYHKIIDADNNGAFNELHGLYVRLFSVITDVFRYPQFFWEIGTNAHVPLESLFLDIPFWSYETYGSVFHTFYDRADYGIRVAPMLLWKTQDDPRYDLISVREKELEIQWSLVSEKSEKERVFSDVALRFYREYLCMEMLQEDDSDWPEMLCHALRIADAQGVNV